MPFAVVIPEDEEDPGIGRAQFLLQLGQARGQEIFQEIFPRIGSKTWKEVATQEDRGRLFLGDACK